LGRDRRKEQKHLMVVEASTVDVGSKLKFYPIRFLILNWFLKSVEEKFH